MESSNAATWRTVNTLEWKKKQKAPAEPKGFGVILGEAQEALADKWSAAAGNLVPNYLNRLSEIQMQDEAYIHQQLIKPDEVKPRRGLHQLNSKGARAGRGVRLTRTGVSRKVRFNDDSGHARSAGAAAAAAASPKPMPGSQFAAYMAAGWTQQQDTAAVGKAGDSSSSRTAGFAARTPPLAARAGSALKSSAGLLKAASDAAAVAMSSNSPANEQSQAAASSCPGAGAAAAGATQQDAAAFSLAGGCSSVEANAAAQQHSSQPQPSPPQPQPQQHAAFAFGSPAAGAGPQATSSAGHAGRAAASASGTAGAGAAPMLDMFLSGADSFATSQAAPRSSNFSYQAGSASGHWSQAAVEGSKTSRVDKQLQQLRLSTALPASSAQDQQAPAGGELGYRPLAISQQLFDRWSIAGSGTAAPAAPTAQLAAGGSSTATAGPAGSKADGSSGRGGALSASRPSSRRSMDVAADAGGGGGVSGQRRMSSSNIPAGLTGDSQPSVAGGRGGGHRASRDFGHPGGPPSQQQCELLPTNHSSSSTNSSSEGAPAGQGASGRPGSRASGGSSRALVAEAGGPAGSARGHRSTADHLMFESSSKAPRSSNSSIALMATSAAAADSGSDLMLGRSPSPLRGTLAGGQQPAAAAGGAGVSGRRSNPRSSRMSSDMVNVVSLTGPTTSVRAASAAGGTGGGAGAAGGGAAAAPLWRASSGGLPLSPTKAAGSSTSSSSQGVHLPDIGPGGGGSGRAASGMIKHKPDRR